MNLNIEYKKCVEYFPSLFYALPSIIDMNHDQVTHNCTDPQYFMFWGFSIRIITLRFNSSDVVFGVVIL